MKHEVRIMIKHECAICGSPMTLDECNVCDDCGWEQDTVQEAEHDYRGGANPDSFNERKALWERSSKATA